jgi:hypothetical protein
MLDLGPPPAYAARRMTSAGSGLNIIGVHEASGQARLSTSHDRKWADKKAAPVVRKPRRQSSTVQI